MAKTGIEVVRRVYNEDEGVCLEVGPDGDGLGLVCLAARGKANEDWFGGLMVSFDPSYAISLGQALILAGEEALKEETL